LKNLPDFEFVLKEIDEHSRFDSGIDFFEKSILLLEKIFEISQLPAFSDSENQNFFFEIFKQNLPFKEIEYYLQLLHDLISGKKKEIVAILTETENPRVADIIFSDVEIFEKIKWQKIFSNLKKTQQKILKEIFDEKKISPFFFSPEKLAELTDFLPAENPEIQKIFNEIIFFLQKNEKKNLSEICDFLNFVRENFPDLLKSFYFWNLLKKILEWEKNAGAAIFHFENFLKNDIDRLDKTKKKFIFFLETEYKKYAEISNQFQKLNPIRFYEKITDPKIVRKFDEQNSLFDFSIKKINGNILYIHQLARQNFVIIPAGEKFAGIFTDEIFNCGALALRLTKKDSQQKYILLAHLSADEN